MSNQVIVITDAEFEQAALQSDQPVLVYFWASWCGPCRLMSPILDSLSAAYGDRLKIVKMEVDPNPETVSTYKVQGVPALRLLANGELIESCEGAMSKPQIEALLEAHLPTVA
ncbi:MAG: thioredoxin [Leptolyngbyaceae cyanobacterium MO_188.B28]|nr:thioredoxin [Leptolyngbyaceae cyanobacterium MO_188.B28]